MIRAIVVAALGAAGLDAFSAAAHAHATLEVREAPADSFYKAVIRTPHGCSGSPTIAVRVQVPEGVTGAKPQPKPGWEVEIVKEALAEPFTDAHGNQVTERVTEIRWTGGRLLDEHYDEFVMRVRLPGRPGETLYFPTVQECEEGVERWIEIPAAEQSGDDLEHPAPSLRLTEPH